MLSGFHSVAREAHVAAVHCRILGLLSGGIGGRSGSTAFLGGELQEGGPRSRRRRSSATAAPLQLLDGGRQATGRTRQYITQLLR